MLFGLYSKKEVVGMLMAALCDDNVKIGNDELIDLIDGCVMMPHEDTLYNYSAYRVIKGRYIGSDHN